MQERKAARYVGGAAIVAGGSGGVGRAIARTLAASGSDVVVTYNRNRASADEAVEEIGALGRRALAVQVDLRDADAVVRTFADAAAGLGGIHTAVYAAGPYIDMRYVSRLPPALFEQTVSTDVFGAYNFLHASLPHLRERQGALVTLGTPAIRRAALRDVMSAAPKAAIEAVIRAVAAEEGQFGVRANFVGVGVITDGMYHQLVATGDFTDAYFEATRKVLALRRLGRAQDIANAVDFLASDAAGFITGQSLMVDGGYAL